MKYRLSTDLHRSSQSEDDESSEDGNPVSVKWAEKGQFLFHIYVLNEKNHYFSLQKVMEVQAIYRSSHFW